MIRTLAPDEESVKKEELYQQWRFETSINAFFLFCVSITKPFRADVLDFQKTNKINVTANQQKLLSLGVDKSVLPFVLMFLPEIAGSKNELKLTVYWDADSRTRIQYGEQETDFEKLYFGLQKVQEYEKNHISENMLASFYDKYKLGLRYRRRLKSILLYNDFPRLEDVTVLSGNRSNDWVRKDKGWMRIFKRLWGLVHGSVDILYEEGNPYLDLRIYGDSDLNTLSTDDIRNAVLKIQKKLPGYRNTEFFGRENMHRDAVYYYFREYEHLPHDQAMEKMKELGFYEYSSPKNASDAMRRFEKFATDESDNK